MKRNPKKIIFSLVSIFLIGLTIYFGYNRYQEVASEYQAAIEAASKIGILSQSLVNYADKLWHSNSQTAFENNKERIKKLIEVLEVRHLSLFKGKPDFSLTARYAEDIKTIYYLTPYNAVVQVQEFLYHANRLTEISYQNKSALAPHVVFMRSAVKRKLVLSLSQIIRLYKIKLEQRINAIILFLIASLILLMVSEFLAAIYLFASSSEEMMVKFPQQEFDNSVAPILNELIMTQDDKQTNSIPFEFSTLKISDA